MSEIPTTPVDDLQRQLEAKQAEIDALTAQLEAATARTKLHAKRVMKQGTEAYFAGKAQNPYTAESDDAELWGFGFNLARDNWDDIRKPPAR
jgi:hypothetical protein